MYSARDDVKSKGQGPPSPCKVCSSRFHWDRDCPHWKEYIQTVKRVRSAKFVESDPVRTVDEETMYDHCYNAYMAQSHIDPYVYSERSLKSSMRVQTALPTIPEEPEPRTYSSRPTVEEVEDEEILLDRERSHISYEQDVLLEEVVPTTSSKIVRLVPGRRTQMPGLASEGVSVLATEGRLMQLDGLEVTLRYDSGADITLLSEDTYLKLRNPPPLKKGMKINLLQLTSEETSVKGFINLPIFVTLDDGTILEMEVEAYVVSRMTVPILLGEDFHEIFEVGVTRDAVHGTRISFGKGAHSVRATGVPRPKDHALVARKRSMLGGIPVVRAKKDVIIQAGSTHRVEVEGHFIDDRDWLVEKYTIADTDTPVFAIPSTLITRTSPFVPVANLSSHPKTIRRGDVLGELKDPQTYLDGAKDETAYTQMAAHAWTIKALVD
ncbi:uncharacterized protein STEHIDRAFT_27661, partial [Stereum hirsutum FP-91666 SS1]|uniref:uncharacterized protein n=1 Tax=Stereum hirsutum (strain FP-91666) TaxID=721885 RepID=UPI000444A2EF